MLRSESALSHHLLRLLTLHVLHPASRSQWDLGVHMRSRVGPSKLGRSCFPLHRYILTLSFLVHKMQGVRNEHARQWQYATCLRGQEIGRWSAVTFLQGEDRCYMHAYSDTTDGGAMRFYPVEEYRPVPTLQFSPLTTPLHSSQGALIKSHSWQAWIWRNGTPACSVSEEKVFVFVFVISFKLLDVNIKCDTLCASYLWTRACTVPLITIWRGAAISICMVVPLTLTWSMTHILSTLSCIASHAAHVKAGGLLMGCVTKCTRWQGAVVLSSWGSYLPPARVWSSFWDHEPQLWPRSGLSVSWQRHGVIQKFIQLLVQGLQLIFLRSSAKTRQKIVL